MYLLTRRTKIKKNYFFSNSVGLVNKTTQLFLGQPWLPLNIRL